MTIDYNFITLTKINQEFNQDDLSTSFVEK